MCYSEEQSKESFIINLITGYILYTYKNNPTYKILALFFLFIGLMQLFDIIFWNTQNINDENTAKINYVTTKLAMFANHLQPIILAYLIHAFTGKLGKISLIMIFIYIIFIFIYTIEAYNKINYTLVNKVNMNNLIFIKSRDDDLRPSLIWDWNIQENSDLVYPVYIITLTILFYENFKCPLNIVMVFINLFTVTLSTYIYKGQTLGRFWCKFAAWIPLLLILLDKMIEE
jgi:hypothetical protein